MRALRFALPKGRLLKPSLLALRSAGFTTPCPDHLASATLMERAGDIDWIFVRDQDLCAYVDAGAADLGIVGSDQIEENQSISYRPVELNLGRCSLDLIGRTDQLPRKGERIRIASKYPSISSAWARSEELDVTIAKLSGSVELALLLGLADYVVDIVETGRTIRLNGLVSLQKLFAVTAMLLVNQRSWRSRPADIQPMVSAMSRVDRPSEVTQ